MRVSNSGPNEAIKSMDFFEPELYQSATDKINISWRYINYENSPSKQNIFLILKERINCRM